MSVRRASFSVWCMSVVCAVSSKWVWSASIIITLVLVLGQGT